MHEWMFITDSMDIELISHADVIAILDKIVIKWSLTDAALKERLVMTAPCFDTYSMVV